MRAFAPDGVDVVLEVAHGATHDLDVAVLAPGGNGAVCANDGGARLAPVVRDRMTLGTRHQFVLVDTLSDRAKDAAVAAVSAAVADGALPVGEEAGLSLHRYRLADTGAAQAAVEAGAVGKVLADVS